MDKENQFWNFSVKFDERTFCEGHKGIHSVQVKKIEKLYKSEILEFCRPIS